MMDLEPELLLLVMLQLDSLMAFKLRRCCRLLRKLLADGNGLSLWRGLLEGTSGSLASHNIKGGIWLHALVPEDTLLLYARLSSTAELATDLKFKDVAAVHRLLQVSCLRQSPLGIGDIEDGVIEGRELMGGVQTSYHDKGQHFFGSWAFDAEEVGAMLSGEKPGPVQSSLVEFVWPEGFFGDQFEFGVLLNLSRSADDRFVLAWQPSVLTPGLLQEHMDCFDIYVHGHVASPCVTCVDYEGSFSAMSPVPMHNVTLGSSSLTNADALKLLEHDSLICALNIRLCCMGEKVLVTTVNGCDARARPDYRWTESGRKLRCRAQIGYRWIETGLPQVSSESTENWRLIPENGATQSDNSDVAIPLQCLSKTGPKAASPMERSSTKELASHAECWWYGDDCQSYGSISNITEPEDSEVLSLSHELLRAGLQGSPSLESTRLSPSEAIQLRVCNSQSPGSVTFPISHRSSQGQANSGLANSSQELGELWWYGLGMVGLVLQNVPKINFKSLHCWKGLIPVAPGQSSPGLATEVIRDLGLWPHE